MFKIISWNVNGIRAAEKKDFLLWLKKSEADIICIQETKAQIEQLSDALIKPEGYNSVFHSAEKKGYSGVCTYFKESPISITTLGIKEFDSEGRTQFLEYKNFTLINAYFPNSREAGARLDYKISFCNAVLDKCCALVAEGKNIILTGDYNIAHKPIDLANPKANENNAGYLPEERSWLDAFEKAGFVDTFRMFNTNPEQYTWWTYRFKAREKNIGWRLDYFWVNAKFSVKIKKSEIQKDIYGSDHCPVFLETAD